MSKILSEATSKVLSNAKAAVKTVSVNVDVRLRKILYNVVESLAISFDFHYFLLLIAVFTAFKHSYE